MFALVLAVDVLDTDLSELVLYVLVVSMFSARVICKICGQKGSGFVQYDRPCLVYVGVLLRVCFTPQAKVSGN